MANAASTLSTAADISQDAPCFRARKRPHWPSSSSFNQMAPLHAGAAKQRTRCFPLTWRGAGQMWNAKPGRMGVQLARGALFHVFKPDELLRGGGTGAWDHGWNLIAGRALSARTEATA